MIAVPPPSLLIGLLGKRAPRSRSLFPPHRREFCVLLADTLSMAKDHGPRAALETTMSRGPQHRRRIETDSGEIKKDVKINAPGNPDIDATYVRGPAVQQRASSAPLTASCASPTWQKTQAERDATRVRGWFTGVR